MGLFFIKYINAVFHLVEEEGPESDDEEDEDDNDVSLMLMLSTLLLCIHLDIVSHNSEQR